MLKYKYIIRTKYIYMKQFYQTALGKCYDLKLAKADCSFNKLIYCVIYYNFRHIFVSYCDHFRSDQTGPNWKPVNLRIPFRKQIFKWLFWPFSLHDLSIARLSEWMKSILTCVHKLTVSQFLPRNAMHPRYWQWACVRLCLSVCHKSVFYRNGRTNGAGFWYVSFYTVLNGNSVNSKNKGTSLCPKLRT